MKTGFNFKKLKLIIFYILIKRSFDNICLPCLDTNSEYNLLQDYGWQDQGKIDKWQILDKYSMVHKWTFDFVKIF